MCSDELKIKLAEAFSCLNPTLDWICALTAHEAPWH